MGLNFIESQLVSIILPTFNAQKYILTAIDSVLKQTHKNWELLIIDNCSTDNTRNIVSSISDERINFISMEKNMSVVDALNKGLEHSKGTFISFLDSNVLWSPEKLDKQLTYMFVSMAAISHMNYSFVNNKGLKIKGTIHPRRDALIDEKYHTTTAMGLATTMINKQLAPKVSFKKISENSDLRLGIDFLGRQWAIAGLNENLVKYRIQTDQHSAFKIYMSLTEIPVYNRLINFILYLI